MLRVVRRASRSLVQMKANLDGDFHGHGLTIFRRRFELPLAYRLNGFFVEATAEGGGNFYVCRVAIWSDDQRDHDCSRDFLPPRLFAIFRRGLMYGARHRDPVPSRGIDGFLALRLSALRSSVLRSGVARRLVLRALCEHKADEDEHTANQQKPAWVHFSTISFSTISHSTRPYPLECGVTGGPGPPKTRKIW
jgi:hypothetical protein